MINVPLEGLCLSVMFLFTAGVIQPGHYPEWLNVVLTIGVVVLNLCYAFLKRGPRIFLKNLSISIARNRRFLFYIAWQYSGNRLFLRLADLFRHQNPVYQHGLDFQRTV